MKLLSRLVMSLLRVWLGYFVRTEINWINNSHDLHDAVRQLKSTNKLTLWCTGKHKDKRTRSEKSTTESDSELDHEPETNPKRKKQARMEEFEVRRNELVEELRDKHGSTYSMVQYRLWAEMLIAKTHDSIDEAPNAPMFGGKRSRKSGSSEELNEALTGMAQTICNALSPKAPQVSPTGAHPSPTKVVEL